jgi:hypothetical protein
MPPREAKPLLGLLELQPDERIPLCEKLTGVASRILNHRTLENLTAEGIIKCVGVYVGGRLVYAIWFTVSLDRGLVVNAAVAADSSGSNRKAFFEAVDILARSHGCHYAVFSTRRPGAVAVAQSFGYRTDTLNIIKQYG